MKASCWSKIYIFIIGFLSASSPQTLTAQVHLTPWVPVDIALGDTMEKEMYVDPTKIWAIQCEGTESGRKDVFIQQCNDSNLNLS